MARIALASRVLSFLFLSGSLTLAQEVKPGIPCAKSLQPGWATFTDRTHGFCFQYPPQYRSRKPVRRPYLRKESKLLIFLANGEPPRFGENGEWPAASISVVFSTEAFDLERIVIDAPNGVIALSPVQVGSNTFYYWGSGGGGANYPDSYFFNLRGKTLRLTFDGPYNPAEKSPDENTREIERKVLATFELF